MVIRQFSYTVRVCVVGFLVSSIFKASVVGFEIVCRTPLGFIDSYRNFPD